MVEGEEGHKVARSVCCDMAKGGRSVDGCRPMAFSSPKWFGSIKTLNGVIKL